MNQNTTKYLTRGAIALVLILAACCATRPAAAKQFLLQDPANPQAQTLVDVTQQDMKVVMNPSTPQARKYYYTRHSLLDSTDGKYWAYREDAGTMLIRWPVNCQGSPLTYTSGSWQRARKQIVTLPQPPTPPQPTVETQVVPNPPLSPVTVELVNAHSEDLVVSFVGERIPNGRGDEIRIPRGGSARYQIQRDAGSTEQTLLVSPEGEVLEVLAQRPIPPAQLYSVVVYESKIVSVYIDHTGKDRTVPARFRPPSTRKGLRSIGVFPIPGGDAVSEGMQIDVYGAAKFQRNPGAAGRYAAPGGWR